MDFECVHCLGEHPLVAYGNPSIHCIKFLKKDIDDAEQVIDIVWQHLNEANEELDKVSAGDDGAFSRWGINYDE